MVQKVQIVEQPGCLAQLLLIGLALYLAIKVALIAGIVIAVIAVIVGLWNRTLTPAGLIVFAGFGVICYLAVNS